MSNIDNFVDPKTLEIQQGLHAGEFIQTQASEDDDATEEHKFVRRSDNPAGFDIDETDLTNDTDFHEVDLTTYGVSSNAVIVKLRLELNDNLAGSYVLLRHPDESGGHALSANRVQVANVDNSFTVDVPVKNGVVDIRCNPSPLNWTSIDIVVLGWWI